MIKIYRREEARRWLAERSSTIGRESAERVRGAVSEIIDVVRARGDSGIREVAARVGDKIPERFQLSETEIARAIARVLPARKVVIERAAERVKEFGERIKALFRPGTVEYDEFRTGFEFAPVERVACYVPGGLFPLPSTAIMTAVTARVAGVTEVFIIAPALTDEVVFAGSLAGVTEFYAIGGAQAVAAAAFGTESVRRADMFVGPGNAYVTEAKRQLQGVIGIDTVAGPSEIAIIADDTISARWLAADLVSQAEHSPDATAWLLTWLDSVAENAAEEVGRLVALADAGTPGAGGEARAEAGTPGAPIKLPVFIRTSLGKSAILVFDSKQECVEAANLIAPEHLQLQVSDCEVLRSKLRNFGALFVGANATVPYGDYMAGPNHTLPTGGAARFSGALTPAAFLRPRTWIEVPAPAKELSRDTAAFAEIEGLFGHATAARLRVYT